MKPIHTIAITGGVFAGIALAIVGVGLLPQAFAQSEPLKTVENVVTKPFLPAPLDTDKFLKWDFKVDAGVSTDPVHQSTINKIAYGHMSTVTVVETSTGVYSSDALANPHMNYPGIHRSERPAQFAGLAIWSNGTWTLVAPLDGGSFLSMDAGKGVSLPSPCILRDGATSCT